MPFLRRRRLSPADLSTRAAHIAQQGPALGPDVDVRVAGVTWPAVSRLDNLAVVDEKLLAVEHAVMQLRSQANVVRAVQLILTVLLPIGTVMVVLHIGRGPWMVPVMVAGVALIAICLVSLVQASRIAVLLEVRERYQRRFMELVTGA